MKRLFQLTVIQILSIKINYSLIFLNLLLFSCTNNKSGCSSYFPLIINKESPTIEDFDNSFDLILTETGYVMKNHNLTLGGEFWKLKTKNKKFIYGNPDDINSYYSDDDNVEFISILSDSSINYVEDYIIRLYRTKFNLFDSCSNRHVSGSSIIYYNKDQSKILEFVNKKEVEILIFFNK